MYIDASALVAILANAPDRSHLLEAIASSDRRVTSVMSVYQAALGISALTGSSISALSEVMRLVEIARVEVLPVDASMLQELCIAMDRYGKTSGHPASLTLGDCVSYAAAKQAGVDLLYEGETFAATDLG